MNILTFYWHKAPWVLVYMLQQVEYNPYKFADWANTIPNLARVKRRGRLELTARVKLMLAVAYSSWIFFVTGGIVLTIMRGSPLPILLTAFAPLVCVLCLFFATLLLQRLVINPGQRREITTAKNKLARSPAARIAVIGSYGKTTMKELLHTVLGQSSKVSSTPGNKNVLISHARWVNQDLKGDEDILIFEYGEAEPGDIEKLARFSEPNYAVITGLAPAHLDGYKDIQEITADFSAIKQKVETSKIFVNGEVKDLARIFHECAVYSRNGLADMQVAHVSIDFSGTDFTLKRNAKSQKLHTGLLGKHQLGPLCAVIAMAHEFGYSDEEINAGIALTRPFEHRMEPRQVGGAWIIDDTYNGNIEGMRAGLELLADLPGKRKIYVTPGLVDQGSETQRTHRQLGQLIAQAKPDKVVLMSNSVTEIILEAMKRNDFKGEIIVEDNPLEYYTNLEHFLAAGDVAMLQNDWPDSYK